MTHLVRATVVFATDDGLSQLRVDRELGHPSSKPCQLTLVVECAKSVQELHASHECFSCRRVEEIESDEVVDAE